jgi:hypothetical protein
MGGDIDDQARRAEMTWLTDRTALEILRDM